MLTQKARQLWSGIMRRRCFHIGSGGRFGELPPHYGFERTCTLEGSLSPGVFMCPDQYACLAQVTQFTCFTCTKLAFLSVRITTQGLAQVTDCLTPEVS